MTPTIKQLPHLAILDRLRPPPGWRTSHAVISAYSAHTSVIGAVLLALAGEDEDSGNRVAFARAVHALRKNVHFLFQSGRLTCPSRKSSAVGLLDRFLIPVEEDESAPEGRSWHAKFALVRQQPVDAEGERWVFLNSSRNLTRDVSWDLGLALETHEQPGAADAALVPGIGTLADSLGQAFPRLQYLHAASAALKKARWKLPSGIAVESIQLQMPGTGSGLPKPAVPPARILAVSPFVDHAALSALQGWREDRKATLLTTRAALDKLFPDGRPPHEGLHLSTLPGPDLTEPVEGTAAADDDASLPLDQIGLHAKILLAESADGFDLWTGSANLTDRAWTRNAECNVHLRASKPYEVAAGNLLGGLEAFLQLAETVVASQLGREPAKDSAEERLARARSQVSAALARATQQAQGDLAQVSTPELPHPRELEFTLQVAPLDGEFTDWPRGRHQVTIAAGVRSDCLRIRLGLEDAQADWVQVIRWDPALDETRDEAVLSEYLGPRQMLSWVHQILHGYSNNDDGGPWDGQRGPERRRRGARLAGVPSIEQALRTWIKGDAARLGEVDRILRVWQSGAPRRTGRTEASADEDFLQEFSRSWNGLKIHLGLRRD